MPAAQSSAVVTAITSPRRPGHARKKSIITDNGMIGSTKAMMPQATAQIANSGSAAGITRRTASDSALRIDDTIPTEERRPISLPLDQCSMLDIDRVRPSVIPLQQFLSCEARTTAATISIQVTILEAQNLPDVDRAFKGQPDPWVEVDALLHHCTSAAGSSPRPAAVALLRKRTTVKRGFAPSWHETVELQLNVPFACLSSERIDLEIVFRVWDFDMLLQGTGWDSTLLGVTRVRFPIELAPISSTPRLVCEESDCWLPLSKGSVGTVAQGQSHPPQLRFAAQIKIAGCT